MQKIILENKKLNLRWCIISKTRIITLGSMSTLYEHKHKEEETMSLQKYHLRSPWPSLSIFQGSEDYTSRFTGMKECTWSLQEHGMTALFSNLAVSCFRFPQSRLRFSTRYLFPTYTSPVSPYWSPDACWLPPQGRHILGSSLSCVSPSASHRHIASLCL